MLVITTFISKVIHNTYKTKKTSFYLSYFNTSFIVIVDITITIILLLLTNVTYRSTRRFVSMTFNITCTVACIHKY